MKTETFKCDGIGCSKEAHHDHERKNWLALSQPIQNHDWWSLKLDGVFYFCSIQCLLNWTTQAAKIREELHESNKDLPPPRGGVRTKRFPGVYI